MSKVYSAKEKEALAEEVHHLYCKQYLADTGKEYWTKGNYDLLTEKAKQYDRNIVEWLILKLAKVEN